MDLAYVCIGWALLAIGVIGCFLPIVPGPPIAYCALFAALATGDHSAPTVLCLLLAGGLTVAVTVLDYIVPTWGAAKFHCSKFGMIGCFVGTVVGLFFLPLGVVAGPFLGAFVGEIAAGKVFSCSLRGAFGAFLGFLAGICMKLVCCGILAYLFLSALR